MKKMLAIAATALLVLPVLAMAGMTAFDNMTELGPEMAEITGQVGITIDSSIEVTTGYLAWGDSNGYDTTDTAGVLKLDGLTVNGGAPGTALDQTGLTIDAGTTGSTSYLVIGLPSISGKITIANVVLGTMATDAATATNSLGSITIGNLTIPKSTVKISAH